jgi:hypothetical protein
MLRAMAVVVCAAALAPPPAAAATRVVRVACDGRAVGAIPATGGSDQIAIEVVGCPDQAWVVLLSFRREADDYVAGTPQPCPSSSAATAIDVPYTCPLVASTSARRVTLDPPKGAHFVTYSLLAQEEADGGWKARKLGWLVLGGGRKLVTYALRPRPDAQPFHLERLGDYPVITDEDLLYAVIVDAKRDQLHFDLSFNAAKGETPNPAPIRPSFPADAASRGAPPPPEHEAERPYADVLLPFGERFRGGDIVKVTISAEMRVRTKDSTLEKTNNGATTTTIERVTERQIVKLLDDVPYPQVHTRYAYNFSTGLVTSWLRQPGYSRVQTDAAATGANVRYHTVKTDDGGMSVKPVAALSLYPRRVDIQVPLTWKERAIPAPTLGFSLTQPTQDVFLGFSHELVRNAQVFYGWHLGKTDVPGPEDDRSTSVTTVKRFRSNFFLGITLNIGGIKDLITK